MGQIKTQNLQKHEIKKKSEITISSGSLVESAERATASHEWSSSEGGGVEGRKAAAAAEAESRSGWVRRLSATLVAEVASFQTATNFTASGNRVTTSAAEAVAPSATNIGFRRTAASLFTST